MRLVVLVLVTIFLWELLMPSLAQSLLNSPFALAWTYLTPETLPYHAAVSNGENVYVPLSGGRILALKLETGETAWMENYPGDFTTRLQMNEEIIYAALADRSRSDGESVYQLVAIAADKGDILWQHPYSEMVTSLSVRPAGKAGRIYVGTVRGVLYALNSSTGQPIWQFHTRGSIRGPVTQVGSSIYVGSDDGHLYALDAADGTVRWAFKTGGPVRSPVEACSKLVYFGSFDGWVYAVNKRTGKRAWRMRTGAAIQAKPTLVGGHLIVASYDNFVYGLHPSTGSIRWKVRLSGRIVADPLIGDDAVLVSALRDHRLIVLNARDGKVTNTIELGQEFEIAGPPSLVDGTMIMITDRGIVAARSPLSLPRQNAPGRTSIERESKELPRDGFMKRMLSTMPSRYPPDDSRHHPMTHIGRSQD